MTLSDALDENPLIAILRGVRPDEVVAIADQLIDQGVRAIEVPLNSPDPFESIAALSAHCGMRATIGAGTVTTEAEVERLARAGGTIAVSPNTDARVIAACRYHNIDAVPGFMTPSEAFAAVAAGAQWLKLFPAGVLGPAMLSALSAVLTPNVRVLAVGGVGQFNIKQWAAAGAAGVGLGSELYRPGDKPDEVARKCAGIMKALQRNEMQSAQA